LWLTTAWQKVLPGMRISFPEICLAKPILGNIKSN
jgi:hypothetical protein